MTLMSASSKSVAAFAGMEVEDEAASEQIG